MTEIEFVKLLFNNLDTMVTWLDEKSAFPSGKINGLVDFLIDNETLVLQLVLDPKKDRKYIEQIIPKIKITGGPLQQKKGINAEYKRLMNLSSREEPATFKASLELPYLSNCLLGEQYDRVNVNEVDVRYSFVLENKIIEYAIFM